MYDILIFFCIWNDILQYVKEDAQVENSTDAHLIPSFKNEYRLYLDNENAT